MVLDRLRRKVGIAQGGYQVGKRIEIVTKDDRLVRGVVLTAGRGVVQLDIGTAGQRIALVRYDDVAEHRRAADDAPSGSWSATYRAALREGFGEVREAYEGFRRQDDDPGERRS